MKVGTPVNTRATRTGAINTGRFVGRTQIARSPGEWLKVNHAPKGKPVDIKHYRTAQVTPT